jgi:hypothetical protein
MRVNAQVQLGGKIEVNVPLPPGSQVTVFVTEAPEAELHELFEASASSTDFWDNRFDDEDWNDA